MGTNVKILGIAKGVAMAHPGMATVIISLFTDAAMSSEIADKILRANVSDSFHALSIDGCQSTNDSVFLLANGAAGNKRISDTKKEATAIKAISDAFHEVCRTLAIYMARDAEGANKLLICRVNGARTKQDAIQIARKVAGSVLVKCAIAGECAYWGRVIAEVGAAGIPVNPDKISISFGNYLVCKDGFSYNHDKEGVAKYMKGNTIHISVALEDGDCEGEAFGCDLTHEYLKINMEKS
jgi:glutamate N-acetyltransferase/amino-acid N-acetyltransferase